MATIALTQSGRFDQSLSFGNALAPETAQPFTPCAGCPQVYLVVIADASSTYAAQHGVVVWPLGPVPWWSLTPLPFDDVQLVGAGSGGINLIEEASSKRHYRFDNGLLIPQE